MIILNLKTYKESTGGNLDRLLDAVDKFISDHPASKDVIYVAPNMVQLAYAKNKYPNINFVSQHVDSKDAGSTTGHITPESIVDLDIKMSIYNHSEHRVLPNAALETIQAKGMELICCCENTNEALDFLKANPFAIAYEPKDLIGSGVSVTTRPDAVKDFINQTKGKTKVIIGAGVSNGEDVRMGLELGAEGFLLASAFVKAENPYDKLKELVDPFLT